MGFFSEDMVPMLGVYEAETSELMASFESIISRVEQTGSFTPDDIAELFRCAHTTKGSSGMMGLTSLSTLTHRVEDIFDVLRGDPSLAEGHVPDLVDHLYGFIDFVKDELALINNDDYVPADPNGLIDQITADVKLLSGEGGDTSPDADDASADEPAGNAANANDESDESADAAPADAAATNENETTLKISFKADVPMVNARAMVIVKQLSRQVNALTCVPGDLANADAAREINESGLLLTLDKDDADKVKQILAKNSFIKRISVLENAAPKPTAAESPAKTKGAESSSSGEKFVTLRWTNVRDLQNVIGEFLTHTSHLKGLSDELPDGSELRSAVNYTVRLVNDLVYRVNEMAMVSMSSMLPQLSRMVRDMCRASSKQVSFEVHGGDILIDRNLYNSISEPLQHIIRNAVDHGIESPEERLTKGKEARGKVLLSVESFGARVAFRVSDDGRGIDTEKVLAKAEANGMLEKPADQYTHAEALQLTLKAGLSTNHEITQYSGRGVGLDVVDSVVRDFNGDVSIKSELGRGTSITLFLPVAVTSVKSLAFRIGDYACHMPLFNLDKIFVAEEGEKFIVHYEESTLFTYMKREIPVLDMHKLLDSPGTDAFYVVCHSMDEEFVIGVDAIMGEFSCANKPLPICLDTKWQTTCAIRNAAIMDDGSVGYALNAALLAVHAQGRELTRVSHSDKHAHRSTDHYELLSASQIPDQAFLFKIDRDIYGIPVEEVERITAMTACSPTPRNMPYLLGLTNYRNHVVAVFDLAKSAGAEEESQHILILSEGETEYKGLTVTEGMGVHSLRETTLEEEQPEPRSFAGGFHSAALLRTGPKTSPITLLVRD